MAQAVDMEQELEWRVPERKELLNMMHGPPRVGEEERARWVVEKDRGRGELSVYPHPVHSASTGERGPEVVALNRYCKDRVWQQVHFLILLRPEALPKRLQTRHLQAIRGHVPVRKTTMRW